MYICSFVGKTKTLKGSSSAAPWMPLISHIGGLCLWWVEILETCSQKRKSWAIWAFSTLPAICGEKEFLSYVNLRGRSRWLSAVCTAAPGASVLLFHGPEVSANVLRKGSSQLEEARAGLGRWLSSRCLWAWVVFSKKMCIYF